MEYGTLEKKRQRKIFKTNTYFSIFRGSLFFYVLGLVYYIVFNNIKLNLFKIIYLLY